MDMLDDLIGRVVVLDTKSPMLYIGTLAEANDYYLTLTDADVHNMDDSLTTRDVYTMEAKKLGIHANRKRVVVRHAEVVSASALDDIVEY